MKKHFYLTLLLALFSAATVWAQFAPEEGKMYALKETTSGLYLDIQTGVNDGNSYYDDNLSLSANPCVIYFAAGTTDASKWTMKNANGEYVMQQTGNNRHWIVRLGENAYEWTIAEPETGKFTIARADGKFIGADNTTAGVCLYCDRGTGLKFEVEEYKYIVGSYTLKTVTGTFLSSTSVAGDTEFSFQDNATEFIMEPADGNGYYIKLKDSDPATYVSVSSNGWGATASTTPYAWLISAHDTDGYATISRAANSTLSLGHTDRTTSDPPTAIYSNAASTSCNKWYFTGTYNVSTEATIVNSKYRFTSGLIAYAGACNKLRFTLTESAVFYQNGAKRLSFDSFVLYNANGDAVTLTANNITGNNISDFSGMIDGTDGTYSNAAWGSSSATDDWFEILLPAEIDLGGAFSFSFVTENTTMNAKAFEIVTSYEKSDYTFKIDAPQKVSITYKGNDIADGDKITADYDEASFDVDEIAGYETMFVVDKEANTLTLVYVKKYTFSLVDVPTGVKITYDSNEVTDGYIIGLEIDTQVLSITNCPDNYTYDITADHTNKLVTITFTELVTVENPAAVVALIKRIGGDDAAGKFKFVLEPSLNYDQETFVIGREDNKVLIKGTTISAITTGIGWYLQNIAHINIAWNSLNEKTADGSAYADLSNIPVPTSEETHTSDAIYRYYLNYCTFGYSMTTWTWKRWQQEIDWMALHGINMPLQIIGLEEVWRKFLTLEENDVRKYNYTDEEAKAFVPGPAFTAWWGMNNLEGWGGTAADGWGGVQDDAWYTRQQQLATDIVTRQRQLGMQPVLPGFSGMVPSNFQTKTGVTCNAGSWCGFTRPKIVLPSNARFAEIAADYYKCLKEVMGESKYYSIDPFHEGGSISNGTNDDYDAAYAAIYQAMEQAKPGSQWVIQQWQWSDNTHQRRSLNAVPAGRLVVLDLFSDGKPYFDSFGTNGGYAPQDAVFCAIPNFGGRSGLMGRLQNVTDNYFSYKNKYATIKGVGAAPEAIEQTPVMYDLIFQLPWMGSKPDVAEWVDNYSIARYGVDNAEVKEAWSLLRQGVLNYGADAIQGPVEDVWAARPNLDANAASSWGSTISKGKSPAQSTYTKARRQMLIDATYRLLGQKNALALVAGSVYESNYNYDIVEMGGGVLADYAHDLLLGIKEAKNASNTALYETRRDAFLALIADVDEFKGTNLNFRLGKWTQEARDAAAEVTGATTATPDWYEYNNARTIITTWGDQYQNGSGGLRDYSYRSWQGLLKDYYLPRWQYYFNNNCTGPSSYFFFEWNWAHGKTHAVGDASKSNMALAEDATGYSYSRNPEGSTVEVATEVLGKYIIPIKADNGAYYAYRYLTETNNDFTAAVIPVPVGSTVDMNKYFGDLTSGGTKTVTITCDAFSDASNFAAVAVNSGIDGNSYTAKIAISDGTAFTVTVKVVTADFFDAKEALAAVIDLMKPLTAQVGTYKTETEIEMQATTEGGSYYIWCSNPHTVGNDGKGGVAALLDKDNSTYLHSNWSAPSTSNDFLQVELGTGNELKKFKIGVVQRTGAKNDFPEIIEVLGSTDKASWTPITTVNDIPTTAGASWMSDVVVPTADYPYLRFVVTTTDNRIYFHMAEFNLYDATTTADVLDKYDGTALTPEYAAAKYDALLSAMDVYENAATVEELTAATTALQQAYDELKAMIDAINEPVAPMEVVDGAVYRIYGRLSDGTLRTLYTNGAGNRIKWAEFETRTDATTLFVAQKNEIANTWKFVSALGDGIWSHEATLTEDGVELTLSDGTVDETFKIVDNVGRSFVVDGDDLDFYSGGGTNVNTTVTTDFYFEKVSDISPVSYTLTMTKGHKFATLYLPYAVKVPTGVESYVAKMPADGTGATVIELSDALSVVPAYTPVIVYREEALAASVGDYVFSYDNKTAPEEVAVTNALVGKLQETYVEGKQNYQYYMLLTIDENEAFYWIYKEYDENKNLYPGLDKTHIKCAANKAYMELPTSGNPAATYSFRFPGTTAVDEVVTEAAEDDAIYDLQGRKLQAAPEKGVYIVNGKLVVK
ncbi:MAG: alpha-N-acetylglucosaminidase C-terminal domain-containing protein [Bacteroidaceae bacterium]|nr:alpha-N-acetylglucosaminidase C-terminal domain-containing protein [Bacteroidaceae bacterium]